MLISATQPSPSFGEITTAKGAAMTALKQYKEHFPRFLDDMKFVGELNELLETNGGKGLTFHISSDGDSLLYTTSRLKTNNLGEAVWDACEGRINPHSGIHTAIQYLGRIPEKATSIFVKTN